MRFFIYQETKDILLQKVKPTHLVVEFADWFFQEYSTKLLNIDIYALSPDDQGVRHYMLLIIVESQVNDFEGTDLPAEDKINIKNKFVELSTKYNFANEHRINDKDNYIQRTTKRNFAQIKNLEDIVNVTLYIFSAGAKTSMIWGTIDEATAFLKSNSFGDIAYLKEVNAKHCITYNTFRPHESLEMKTPLAYLNSLEGFEASRLDFSVLNV